MLLKTGRQLFEILEKLIYKQKIFNKNFVEYL